MCKLKVQLTENQVRALKSVSAEQGVSAAELIRRGVDWQISEEYALTRLKQLLAQLEPATWRNSTTVTFPRQ